MTAAPPARRYEGAGSLAALYVVAVVVYVLLGHRQPVPLITPDEFNYGHLARSLADGEGMTWRGEPVEIRAALYIYAITPAYAWWSLTSAYEVAKLEGAILASLAVVPAWLLARPALGPRLALVPAALTVAGTWMTSTAGLLTENLAYPLATAALAATVAAAARPGSRWGWAALAFAVVAAWARLQCVALVPVLALSLAGAALACGEPVRGRLRADRWVLAVSWSVTVAGVVLILADPGILGSYAGIGRFRPSLERLLSAVGHQSIGLVAMAGLLPPVVVAAASTRRTAWRDARLGPLLVVTWCATVVLVVQSGWTVTGFGAWHIQRYVQYALPLLFVAAVAAVHGGFVGRARLGGATVVVAALLLASPDVRQVLEERGVFALRLRGDDLLGLGAGASLALATLLVGGLAALLVTRPAPPRAPGTAVLILAALTGAVLLVQDQAGWSWQTRLAKAWRAGYPHDLSWIDHAGDGEVARIVVTGSSARWPVTEFFNRDVTQVYVPAGVPKGNVRGPVCLWGPQPDGTLQFQGSCDAPPRRYLVDDDVSRVTFHEGRTEASHPLVGTTTAVPGTARLRSIVNVPCGRAMPRVDTTRRGRISPPVSGCAPSVDGHLWLDAPGVVGLRFRGDGAPHGVQAGARRYELRPQGSTTIRLPAPAGSSGFTAELDWQGPSPALTGVVLAQDGTTTDLLR